MRPFSTITDTTPANPTTTHPPSPPPPCAARVVVDKPSFPPPPRTPANTSLQLTSTPREIRVPTISSIILDKDVTEPTMTMTLQRARCVVGVSKHSVQTQITISSTQLEKRVPLTSLTAADEATHRISLLKSFVVNVAVASSGAPAQFKCHPQLLHVLTRYQTTTTIRVLNTTKTHRRAERTLWVLSSIISSALNTPNILRMHTKQVRHTGLQFLENMLCMWWRGAASSCGYYRCK